MWNVLFLGQISGSWSELNDCRRKFQKKAFFAAFRFCFSLQLFQIKPNAFFAAKAFPKRGNQCLHCSWLKINARRIKFKKRLSVKKFFSKTYFFGLIIILWWWNSKHFSCSGKRFFSWTNTLLMTWIGWLPKKISEETIFCSFPLSINVNLNKTFSQMLKSMLTLIITLLLAWIERPTYKI